MLLSAFDEPSIGGKWRARFQTTWPRYRGWYLSEGIEARPSAEKCRKRLLEVMPELVPVYDDACALVGPDEVAHRALALYDTPPVIAGCSVAVAPGDEPVLVRNYDFAPDFFEGTICRTQWTGNHQVLATAEGWLGALDGVNSAGLCAALTFGGRPVNGPDGFLSALLVRYVLEICATVVEAARVLARLPAQMVNNVILLDASGDFAVVYLSPDRAAEIRKLPVCTNHQLALEWPRGNRFSETAKRAAYLTALREAGTGLAEFVEAFFAPPLFRTDYAEALGTLYTAVIRPASGAIDYVWPDAAPWHQSLAAFEEGERVLPIKPA